MISFEHKAIFIHLKRTGGNSIEIALGGLVLLDENGKPTNTWTNKLHRAKAKNKIEKRGTEIHATAVETRAQYPDEFERFFKFSVVRNPYAQIFSLYKRMKPRQDHTPENFEEYLDTIIQKSRIVPRMALCDETGEDLMDEIIKFESLGTDFEKIAHKIGFEKTSLPVSNSSRESDYRKFYTPAARRWVEDTYGADIEKYGYAF